MADPVAIAVDVATDLQPLNRGWARPAAVS